jgi:hypothetical protein
MGSYPYPSSYMTNGQGLLPAYPLRVGCKALAAVPANAPDAQLLGAFADAIGVWFNYTGDLTCFDWNAAPNNATQLDGELWGILACAELAMPMSQNGVQDMFFPAPWNSTVYAQGCMQQWSIDTRFDWPTVRAKKAGRILGKRWWSAGTDRNDGEEEQRGMIVLCVYFCLQIKYGGVKVLTKTANTTEAASDRSTWGKGLEWGGSGGASNILFSNGQLDPWRGGGITYNISFDRDVTAWIVEDAGHHMDLMFSNPLDMNSVKFVRAEERAAIQRWIIGAAAERGLAMNL